MSTAHRGDVVLVETVSRYSTLYAGSGLHVRLRLATVASATRAGIVKSVDNPGGKPLRITTNDTVYTLPASVRPEVAELLGETWDDMSEAREAIRRYSR